MWLTQTDMPRQTYDCIYCIVFTCHYCLKKTAIEITLIIQNNTMDSEYYGTTHRTLILGANA